MSAENGIKFKENSPLFWEVYPRVYLDFGLRADQETNQYRPVTITSHRYYGTLGGRFFLDEIIPLEPLSIYLGIFLGLGFSNTDIDERPQEGRTSILPLTSIGLDVPLPDPHWRINLEAAMESITLRERIQAGPEQTATQINGKLGLGIRYDF